MTGGTRLAAGTLGFALGGFFDGILLHQILQWHHLLSLVPGEAMRDLRVQVLADGLFHLLVYLIAMLGLWRLWRGRAELGTGPGAGRPLLGAALVGLVLMHSGREAGFGGIGFTPTSQGGTHIVEKNLTRLTVAVAILFTVNTVVLYRLLA